MRYNLDLPINTIDGSPFDPPSTLKAAAFTAVVSAAKSDEHLGVEAKLGLHSLSVCIHGGGIVELKAEDVAKIKERAAALFSIHFFGQMVALLEGGAVVNHEVALKVVS
jgi:hypothetical protein